MRVRGVLAFAAVLVVAATSPAFARAADPLEGRWELVTPSGAPAAGFPIYDFLATGPNTFTNKVVRPWGFGCGTADGDIKLTRIAGPATEPAYRGTETARHQLGCAPIGETPIELVIRPDGMAILSYRNGSGVIQYLQRRSLQVSLLSLNFRERKEQALEQLLPRVRKLGARWNALQKSIRENYARARRELDTTAERTEIRALEADLARAGKNLARIAAAERKSPDDPRVRAFRDAWEKEASKLRREIFRVELVLAREEYVRFEAERALQQDVAERGRLDRELTEIGTRLAAFDFDVREVTMTADGVVVFRATANTVRARILKRIDEKLDRTGRLLVQLEAERKSAKEEFVAAQRDVIAAGERLIEVIWQNTAGNFAIDAGFLALDLGLAYARGNVIGLAAEVAKKAAETALFAALPSSSAGDPVAKELRERYGAKLKDSLSGEAVARAAGDRLLKETAFKISFKDPATKFIIERVLNPAKLEAAFDAAGQAIAREPTAERLLAVERTVKKLNQVRDRIDDYTRRQAGKPSALRGLAQNLVKDIAKTALKRVLEERERAAWVAYYEQDLRARALWAHLQTASSYYWEMVDVQEGLGAERRRQAQLPGSERVVVNAPFSRAATLRISLKGEGKPGSLAVVVGGARATPLGGFVFQLAGGAAQADPSGAVVLEIR